MKLPLIRRRLATPSPRGEGFKRGNHFAFKRNETVRYKTGDARPGGGKKGYIKGIYLNFKRFAKFRYEAPEGRYLNMRRRIKPTKNATIAETTDFITSNALSRLLFSFSRG